LADEIHLLVHPELVGGSTPNSIFQTNDTDGELEPIKLYLGGMEKIKDDIIYLRYRILDGMFK